MSIMTSLLGAASIHLNTVTEPGTLPMVTPLLLAARQASLTPSAANDILWDTLKKDGESAFAGEGDKEAWNRLIDGAQTSTHHPVDLDKYVILISASVELTQPDC